MVASTVAGIGVTVVFSVAIWGRRASSTSAAANGRLAAGARRWSRLWRCWRRAGGVVLGIIVMTSK